MDKLARCTHAFKNLLDIQYRIIIGRKGKSQELRIGFSKLDFHHLMGLGKSSSKAFSQCEKIPPFRSVLWAVTS